MNVYIIIGIILAALGTFILTYGGVVQSRKDAEKSERIAAEQYYELSKDIAELKGKPRAELSFEAVNKVENDVQKWAKAFVAEKDRLKNIHDNKLQEEERRLYSSHTLSRDYFSFLITTIKKAVDTYNKELNASIATEFPEISTNLFNSSDERFQGKVVYSNTAIWDIKAYLSSPSPDVSGPIILITGSDDPKMKTQTKEKTELLLRFGKDSENFHIRLTGAFLLAYGSHSINGKIEDYEETVKKIIKALFENQLLSLS